MTISLDAIKKFAKKLADAEYYVQYAKYGDTPRDAMNEKIRAYAPFFDAGVKTKLAFSKGPEEQRKMLAKRRVLAYALFEHAKHKEAWALYVTGLFEFSQGL